MAATPITAYAAYNALGTDADSVLSALREGRSGLRSVPETAELGPVFGRASDPPGLPEPFEGYNGRAARLLAAALTEVSEAVIVAKRRWGPHRVGMVLGVHGPTERWLSPPDGAQTTMQTAHALGSQGPLLFAREALSLRGPTFCVHAEGAAGLAAISSAHRLIGAGLADAVITGGVGAMSSVAGRSFAARRLLSAEAARPMSVARAGTSLGEGAALLLLERHGDAFLEVCGTAESQHDGPHGRAPIEAMQGALRASGVDSSAIGFVQTLAPALITHDFAEASAIAECFEPSMPVASLIGATGWILGAGGATEVLAAAAAVRDGVIPPTIGCDPADATLPVKPSPTRRELEHDHVLVHGATLGGRSIACVIGARQ